MSEHVHDNLSTLHEVFSRERIESLYSGESTRVDGVEFVCQYAPGSTAERFYIVKPIEFVEHCLGLYGEYTGSNIVELGIAEGGSTALLALVARPRKLIALDIEPQPLAALAQFVEQRELAEVVRAHYGVDQSDRDRVASIVDDELGGDALDLVIDDASHQFDATRASFETLFPRLRPGGVYLIEDWNADHTFRDAVVDALKDPDRPDHEERVRRFAQARASLPDESQPPPPSLSRLGVELLVARAGSGDAIAEVAFNEFYIRVERGRAALDPASFRLEDHYRDYFGYLNVG